MEIKINGRRTQISVLDLNEYVEFKDYWIKGDGNIIVYPSMDIKKHSLYIYNDELYIAYNSNLLDIDENNNPIAFDTLTLYKISEGYDDMSLAPTLYYTIGDITVSIVDKREVAELHWNDRLDTNG